MTISAETLYGPHPCMMGQAPEVLAAGPRPAEPLGFLLNEASPLIWALQLLPVWGPASPSNLITMTAGSEQLLALGWDPRPVFGSTICRLSSSARSLGLWASHAPFPEEEF